jgi:DNA-binding CsgD family transcriptional regulator
MKRDGLEIYVMEDSRGFSALQPAWEDLLVDSPSDCMFLTWEWLHAWYKHLGQQRKLHIITVWDGATLVALAPLIVVNRRLPAAAPLQKPTLTPRQTEVLKLIAAGRSGKEIASILNVSLKTVEFHKYRMTEKLNLHTTAELTRYAIRNGIVSA